MKTLIEKTRQLTPQEEYNQARMLETHCLARLRMATKRLQLGEITHDEYQEHEQAFILSRAEAHRAFKALKAAEAAEAAVKRSGVPAVPLALSARRGSVFLTTFLVGACMVLAWFLR